MVGACRAAREVKMSRACGQGTAQPRWLYRLICSCGFSSMLTDRAEGEEAPLLSARKCRRGLRRRARGPIGSKA